MVRSSGARLAVLLLATAAILTGPVPASAEEGCVEVPEGLACTFDGSTWVIVVTPLPPLRYLRTDDLTGIGRCWYWSRYPPGLDAEDPAQADLIDAARTLFPPCPDGDGGVLVSAASRAWEVFRAFPLSRPDPRTRPIVGIAHLPTLLSLDRPATLAHAEVLPDGRLLEVVARVGRVIVEWGDGDVVSMSPAAAFPGPAAHAYTLKTCPEEDRPSTPPAGPCHPSLAAYRIRATFAWTARYRAGGDWITLGEITRWRTLWHDVDEVIGVLVAP